MSFPLEFQLSLKGDAEIQSRLQDLEQAVDSLSKSASSASSPMSGASEAIKEMGKSASTSSDALNQFSDASASTADKVGGLKQSLSTLGGAIKSSSGAIAAASGSALGLYQSFDRLEKIELRASKSALGVQRAQQAVVDATERLNKAQTDGKSSTQDVADASAKLKNAQDALAIAQDRNQIAQGDVNEAYAHFAANIAPEVIGVGGSLFQLYTNLSKNSSALRSGITGVVGAFTNFGGSLKSTIPGLIGIKSNLATLPTSLNTAKASTVGLSGALGTVPAAAVGARAAIAGVALSLKTLLLANIPLTVALIGISTVMGAVATNAFGLRDAMNSAGKAIGDALPALRPVLGILTELGKAIGITTDEIKSGAGSQNDYNAQIDEMTKKLDQGSAAGKTFQEALQGLAKSESDAGTDALAYLQIHSNLSDQFVLTNDQTIALAEAQKKLDQTQRDNLNTQIELVSHYEDMKTIQKALATDGFQALYNNIKPYDDELQNSIELTNKHNKAIQEIKNTLAEVSDGFRSNADINKIIIAQLDKTVDVTKLTTVQLEALARADLEAAQGANDHYFKALAEAKAVGYVGDTTEKSIPQMEAWTKAHKESDKAVADVTSALSEWNSKLAAAAASGSVLAQQLGITDTKLLNNGKNLAILNETTQKYIDATEGTELATRAEAAAAQALNPALGANINAYNDSIPVLNAFIEKVKQSNDANEQVRKTLSQLKDPFNDQRILNERLALALGLTSDASKLTSLQLETLVQSHVDAKDAIAQNIVQLATEAVKLGFVGDVTKATANDLQRFIDKQKAAKDAADKAAAETAKYREELSKLDPRLQALLASQGLLNNAMAGMTGIGARIVSAVKRVQSAYESARAAAEDFAIAHGTSIVKAASLSDAALLRSIRSQARHDAQQEISKQKAEKAAHDYADVWSTALDKVSNKLSAASDAFAKAFQDVKEGFGNPTLQQTVEDFWNTIIPTEFINTHLTNAATGIKDFISQFSGGAMKKVQETMSQLGPNMNIPGGLSGAQAKEFFGPFLAELNKLPKEMQGSFGAAVAAAEHFSQELKPALLGGIITVGPDAKKLIKTSFEDKMVDALQDSKGQLGKGFIDSVQGAIKTLEAKNPDAAAFIKEQLKLAGPNIQDQVRTLLATLDQIDPGFKDMIMKIDSDGDGIADIMDKKFNNPMEDFKNSTVDAFQQVLKELSKIPQTINNAFSGMEGIFDKFGNKVGEINLAWGGFAQLSAKATAGLTSTATAAGNVAAGMSGTATAAINLGNAAAAVPAKVDPMTAALNKTIDVTTQMSIAWNNHEQVFEGIISKLIIQVSSYANAVGAIGPGITADLGKIATAWSTHLTSVGDIINQIIQAASGYAGGFGNIATQVGNALAGVVGVLRSNIDTVAGWVAAVAKDVGSAASAFAQYPAQLGDYLGKAIITLGGHLTGVGVWVGQVRDKIGDLIGQYSAYPQKIGEFLGNVIIQLGGHVTAIGTQITAIGQKIGTAIGSYSKYATDAATNLSNIILSWGSHLGSIITLTSRVVKAIGGIGGVYTTLKTTTQTTLDAIKGMWNGALSALEKAVQDLTGKIKGMFGGIQQQAANAVGSIHQVAAAMNSVQSRTVTLTTVHRTVNQMVSAQHGFSGIVNSETHFRVGEGNKPEFVQVVPLTSGSSSMMNTTKIQTPVSGNIRNVPLNKPLGSLAGSSGGGVTKTLNLNISVPVDGRVIGQVSRKFNLDNLSGQF